MPKKQFLSKLNKPDYNNLLEEVLENKSFTADTKSLLLSMLYKVETGYGDYSKVKRNVIGKSEFIEQLIYTIKYCCSEIKLVEPKSEMGKELEGKRAIVEGSKIIAFPTEYALLTGISKMVPTDFKTQNIFSLEFEKILELGYKNGITETILSFDGWTWNISRISEYILLYMNLETLLDWSFIEEWKVGKNNFDKLKEQIFRVYGGENELVLVKNLLPVIVRGFVTDFPDRANEYLKRLEEDREEFRKLNSTREYLDQISNQRKKVNMRIMEIDKVLLDPELLQYEYEKENDSRPAERKLFSIRHFEQLLRRKKIDLMKEINDCNQAITPRSLVKRKEELSRVIEEYEIIEEALNEPREFKQLVLEFQSTFLKVWGTKVERASTKKELIDLIYRLRYYKNLLLDKPIKEIPGIKDDIDLFERNLLLKAANSDVFVELSENKLHTVQILFQILDTKIIDLEEIYISPKVTGNVISLDIYDGEVLDRTIKLSKEINAIQIKEKKKVKLFN